MARDAAKLKLIIKKIKPDSNKRQKSKVAAPITSPTHTVVAEENTS